MNGRNKVIISVVNRSNRIKGAVLQLCRKLVPVVLRVVG